GVRRVRRGLLQRGRRRRTARAHGRTGPAASRARTARSHRENRQRSRGGDGEMLTSVFDEWRGRPVDDIIAASKDLLEDAAFPTVKRWRAAGGQVLGNFQVYFPEELAHAAGMLPVKVMGAPVEGRH